MRKKTFWGTIGLIVLLFFILVLPRAGTWLIKENTLQKSDAIILLMGNIPDRVLQAGDLYKQALATRMLIVEENMTGIDFLKEHGIELISNSQQARNAMIRQGVPEDSVLILPCGARSTLMEAQTVAHYISSNPQVNTLIIRRISYRVGDRCK
jgi:uncharacterized SAM-binding protein YcdF (DUF218 family)